MLNLLNYITRAPLNKRRKMAALLGFAKWQFLSRLHGGKFVIDWIDEARLIIGNGETGLTGNIYTGLMEFDDMAFVLSAVRADDLFLDIGANVGAYTVLASKLCGATTYAFEPVPSTYRRLLDQINLNALAGQTVCMNVALGNSSEKIKFTANSDTMNKVAVAGFQGDVVEVDVTMLDDIQLPHDKDIFVKIDVEGFEMNVLRGGSKTFSDPRVQAVIIELNGSGKAYGFEDVDIHQKLLEFGLLPIKYDGLTRQILRADSFDEGGNTIYVRDIEKVKQRCLLGPKRVVHTVGGAAI